MSSSVVVDTDLYGTFECLVRRADARRVVLETADPLPFGTLVRLRFGGQDGLVVTGRVVAHRYLNYMVAGDYRAWSGMDVCVDQVVAATPARAAGAVAGAEVQ